MNLDPIKIALWAKHLQDCTLSGTTVADYCRQQALCKSTFYAWRKRLGSIAADSLLVSIPIDASKQCSVPCVANLKPKSKIPNVAVNKPSKPTQFVPASIQIDAKFAEVVLRSPTGWVINLPDLADLSSLAQLLRVLP
jgi:hypothetical protein